MSQQACAAILARKDKTVREDELKDFLIIQSATYSDSFLANRFIPKIFLLFDTFPRNHSGKVDKKLLREEIKRRMSSA